MPEVEEESDISNDGLETESQNDTVQNAVTKGPDCQRGGHYSENRESHRKSLLKYINKVN